MTDWLRTIAPRRALLLAAIAALLLPVLGCSGGETPTTPAPSSPEEIGLQEVEVPAPDFTLPTLAGGDMTLSGLKGRVVLVNFWQLNCPPCEEEMPFLEAAAKQFDGQAYVLAVGIAVDAAGARDFVGEGDFTMLVPLDSQARAAAMYSVGFTPTTFLIDANGIVRYVKVGAFSNAVEVSSAIQFTLSRGA